MIERDPTLDAIGLLIFDEYHERSIHADVGLALALRSRKLLREDLRILVMSATLDDTRVAALLGDAPIVSSVGRAYPVHISYATSGATDCEGAVASAVMRAIAEDDGDILAFLPGVREIKRAATLLATRGVPGSVKIVPLYGDLPQAEQDAATSAPRAGERRVVLATSIAETSLTIQGVRVVIDSGLAREPRFSPRSGMTRLETVRVSRAAAAQRAGRAGRVAPGKCYRLWPEQENSHLLEHAPAEILRADLVPLALALAAAGVDDPTELEWLDPPPEAAYRHAKELLSELGAIAVGVDNCSRTIDCGASDSPAPRSHGSQRCRARIRGHRM